MTALILATCAMLGFVSPHSNTSQLAVTTGVAIRQNSPLKIPAGWKSEQEEGSTTTILTPGDVAEGKLYKVIVTFTRDEAGSLDEILEASKARVAELGTFKAAMDPKQSASDGGWDYKFVLGALETKDGALLAQLMAIRKGEEAGVVVVLSDSVETMGNYADAFATMIRGMGAAEQAPAPANTGVVDLQYTVPAGWVQQDLNGYPLLVKEKDEQWVKYRFSLLIFPTETLTGTVREQFGGYWKSFISPNYISNVAPLPLMTRLQSGYACAFDADSEAKTANGGEATVALYMLAHGGRVVPVMGIYSGPNWSFDKTAEAEIAQFLDTAQIPGASAEKVALFSAADLPGEWAESSSSFANYVTAAGAYAGDATISTGVYLTLGTDGSYSHTLMALTRGSTVREKNAGTWTLDDDELVLSNGGRYILFGYGSDAKIGRFLVLGKYSNARSRLNFTNPRGLFQAEWLKAK